MKRMKTFVLCMVVACMAALLAFATGCSSQQNYTPPDKTPTLSSPAIGKDGTLRVGVNSDSAPLAGQPSSSTKVVGIDVDVAAALADSFGLKLEIVDVGTEADAALAENRVDIVLGIDKADNEVAFWKSEAYLPTAVALFSASSDMQVPTNDDMPSIAAQVSSKSAWAVMNEFDEGSITTTDDLKGAFSALTSSQVQYVAADAVVGTYAAHNAGNNVHIVALMQQMGGYCVGVLDSNTDLKQAVSDALATLAGNGVISVIEMKWLGTSLDLSATPLTESATANQSMTTNGDDAANTATVAPDDTAAANTATATPDDTAAANTATVAPDDTAAAGTTAAGGTTAAADNAATNDTNTPTATDATPTAA